MPVTPGVYLNWTQGLSVLIGQVNLVFQENEAVQGISFPNDQTVPVNVHLSSSARDQHTFDTFRNVRLYLTGDPAQVQIVQEVWPSQGGGLFISFDGGKTYTVFSPTYGFEADPSTWVLIPAAAIGIGATDGVLGILDSANLVLKYVIPEQADQFQVFEVQLTADFDIV